MAKALCFIVDESTGAAVAEYLRDVGHDVLAVAEAIPQTPDEDILAKAANEQRILVTNDKDFGKLVYRSGRAHSGIVLFRLRDESVENRVRQMRLLLTRYAERLPGNFIVATEVGVRIRPARPPA